MELVILNDALAFKRKVPRRDGLAKGSETALIDQYKKQLTYELIKSKSKCHSPELA